MDDNGYAFTPMALLLMVPIVIVAVSYGNIVNELNMISQIAVSGDITYGTTSNIIDTLQKSLGDAGRNATFNATRTVINSETLIHGHGNPFLTDSRSYIEEVTANELNTAIISTCQNLKNETGRQIYVNNVLITDNSTSDNTFALTKNDFTIYQEEPFGFFISINKGIPLTVVYDGQNFTGYTSNITAYVSIQGMEDPYIWINSLNRRSDVIYKYPFYDSYYNNYHFDDSSTGKLQHLWDCLNGTNNNANITNNPYYFPDPYGLNFFDRLENRTSSNDTNNQTRMSTFIVGDPLQLNVQGTKNISAVDRQYFNNVQGKPIKIGGLNFQDPYPSTFYLSNSNPNYFTVFNIGTSY